MKYTYRMKGTCAREVSFSLSDNVVTNIQFLGGCDGNLKAISKILEGWTLEQVEAKALGNTCGMKSTSCFEQLAFALRAAYEQAGKPA